MINALIIENDNKWSTALKQYLAKKKCNVVSAGNGKAGIRKLRKEYFDVVFLELNLKDINGASYVSGIRKILPDSGIYVMSKKPDVKEAVQVIKAGADDYLPHPVKTNHISAALTNLTKNRAGKPVSETSNKIIFNKEYISGVSDKATRIEEQVKLVSPTDLSVILYGETGSGKELVARQIHINSSRKKNALVAVDCGALPPDLIESSLFGHKKGSFTGATSDKKGYFEAAHKGTLFLDEINNLSYSLQSKLLRVLQEKKIYPVGGSRPKSIDVRILIASNVNLQEAVRRNVFRGDLYYRINEFQIRIPPLRSRKEDIMLFANHFLTLANTELNKSVEGFDRDTKKLLLNYPWPGNIRELRNTIKRSVLLSTNSSIKPGVLPDEIVEYRNEEDSDLELSALPFDLNAATEAAEVLTIKRALRRTNNNKSQAADLLNIDRKTLYNKLKSYSIEL